MRMQDIRNMIRKTAAALLASLAAAGCMEFSDIAESMDDMRVVARIGVVAHPEIGASGSEGRLQKALLYFQARKVDSIVVIGNLTKDGYLNQYRKLAGVWDKVFANPIKGTDRNPPRRICVLGPRDLVNYKESFARELEGTLGEGGEFDVNGFKFRAQCARPAAAADGGATIPVVFSDGKNALTDELCFYPRESAAVNAGSLSGVVLREGYEPVKEAASSSQGLLLSAYSDKVVVSRLDFTQKAPLDKDEAARIKAKRMPYAEKVADDWVIPLAKGVAATPLPAKSPSFWDDTRLIVTRGTANGVTVFKVMWPPVLAKFTGERAFSYEVEALLCAADRGDGAAIKRIYVLSPRFHLSEDRDNSPVFCNFYETDFPSGARVRFAVTPVSSTGAHGARIVSEEYCVQR